jgi:hypothetical protein
VRPAVPPGAALPHKEGPAVPIPGLTELLAALAATAVVLAGLLWAAVQWDKPKRRRRT